MSNDRTERLVNLVLCLLSSRRFQTATKIARTVPGYEHDLNDKRAHEAFQRKFERDKAELRRIGVPLQSGTDAYFDSEPGYRIARSDFELPQIEFTDAEAAAVAAAARLWQQPELQSGSEQALRKLRAAGIDVESHAATGPVKTMPGTEAALSPLLEAVSLRRAVTFDYLGAHDETAQKRRLQPWGCAAWRGRWYVAGYDLDRAAQRVFRLSRITAKVRLTGPEDAYEIPADVDVLAFASESEAHQLPSRAKVVVRPRRAWGIRRRADQIGPRTAEGDEACFSYTDTAYTASWLASFGDDVLVLEPPELVKETVACLQNLADEEPAVAAPQTGVNADEL
ncbi:helix-turn-helix transcriptional regulator [Glycomyces buryatensis]|uniref:WYL domain-containing protein n=1 Tax=Glycomyces buryatensis TaxID=2570927 RepID=A0A4S8PQH3_9ACTN|nr:WYL domain-containing protein [Glycomyces buryatensis]THV33390.1 WYL domain-containing protein [Glycomyces buryatensis]